MKHVWGYVWKYHVNIVCRKNSELDNSRESTPIAQVTTHNIILGYCSQLLVINPRELQTG